MTTGEAFKILKYHQEWRIGVQEEMKYSPKQLTDALNVLLSPDYLFDFLMYLYFRKLIDNSSFDYHKEAKKFIKKISKDNSKKICP